MEGEAAVISHSEGFVIRHKDGRYLDSCVRSEGFKAGDPIPPLAVCFRLTPNGLAVSAFAITRKSLEGWLAQPGWHAVADQFEIVPAPGCGVCGTRGGFGVTMYGSKDWTQIRCERHIDRNPCAIEGCKRTREAGNAGLASDQYLCGEHWRKYVPPRSRLRKLYHAHFRRGKREGWTMKRHRQFHRFWDFLVSVARKRHEGGFLHETEINRIMGWD